jgi:hypothetical protein
VTVLPAFVVSTVTDPGGAPHFSFTVLAYAVAAAGAAYLAARVTWPHTPGRPAIATGALAGAIVSVAARIAALVAPAGSAARSTTLLFDPAAPTPDAAAVMAARLAFALVLVAGALIALIRHRAPLKSPHGAARPGAWVFVLCLVVSVVAVDARWQELMRVRYEFLLPDAVGYKAIAAEYPAKMAHYHLGRQSALLDDLYAGGYDGRASWLAIFYAAENNGREPGWPALLRLVFDLLGVSAFHSRLTSLGLSALVAGLTCWLGSRTLHPIAGVLGGLFYAFNPAQIANSVAGLREELVGLAFLALVAAFVVPARPHSWSFSWPFRGRARQPVGWTRVLVVGAAGAALVLVRADMLPLAATTITLGALALRWPWRAWLTGSAIVALLAGPMYLGFWFTRLDPFYPGTYGATVNRNLEFPDRMGTPGFPTPEDYAANWAAGPPTTPFKYFFGYHSPTQFIDYTARGFLRIFPTILFRDQTHVLWLCVAGAVLLLATRRWHLPAIVVISLVPFYAFLAGVPNPWVFAPRYAHHALPYAVLAAGYAVAWPLVALWRLTLSARSARPGRGPVAA